MFVAYIIAGLLVYVGIITFGYKDILRAVQEMNPCNEAEKLTYSIIVLLTIFILNMLLWPATLIIGLSIIYIRRKEAEDKCH